MLGIIIGLIFIGGILISLIPKRRGGSPPKSEKPVMLYAPGSEDVAGESYFPARKDGSMPFPVGKREEREKTETFRRSVED